MNNREGKNALRTVQVVPEGLPLLTSVDVTGNLLSYHCFSSLITLETSKAAEHD